MMGCTKFYKKCTNFCKRCTKFCEGYSKGSKVCSEVWIGQESLPYGFPNEIMALGDKMGVPEAIR